jgi:hypothetical protein
MQIWNRSQLVNPDLQHALTTYREALATKDPALASCLSFENYREGARLDVVVGELPGLRVSLKLHAIESLGVGAEASTFLSEFARLPWDKLIQSALGKRAEEARSLIASNTNVKLSSPTADAIENQENAQLAFISSLLRDVKEVEPRLLEPGKKLNYTDPLVDAIMKAILDDWKDLTNDRKTYILEGLTIARDSEQLSAEEKRALILRLSSESERRGYTQDGLCILCGLRASMQDWNQKITEGCNQELLAYHRAQKEKGEARLAVAETLARKSITISEPKFTSYSGGIRLTLT